MIIDVRIDRNHVITGKPDDIIDALAATVDAAAIGTATITDDIITFTAINHLGNFTTLAFRFTVPHATNAKFDDPRFGKKNTKIHVRHNDGKGRW